MLLLVVVQVGTDATSLARIVVVDYQQNQRCT
jgi:hypothetical protein